MLAFQGAKYGMTVARDIASCESLPLPAVFALASSRKIAWTSAFFAFVLRVSQCKSYQDVHGLRLGHPEDFAQDACVPVILATTHLVVMESKPEDSTIMNLSLKEGAPAPSLSINFVGPIRILLWCGPHAAGGRPGRGVQCELSSG
jgi:hypothetical protein